MLGLTLRRLEDKGLGIDVKASGHVIEDVVVSARSLVGLALFFKSDFLFFLVIGDLCRVSFF